MKLDEFFPYFVAGCIGAGAYEFLIYLFSSGYEPNWLAIFIKIIIIAVVMSLSIIFFKNKIGSSSEEE